jgi:hypothetical protein
MKKPIFLLFLVSILLFNGSSCNKEETPFYKLDPVFLSYFAFPKDSWWTYMEIKTGKTDSFYVNKFQIENHNNKKDGTAYERLSYHLFSNNDTAYGDARPAIDPKQNSIYYWYQEHYHAGPVGFDYSADRFLYPARENEVFNEIFYMRAHYDTITVNKILYKDVYRTENTRQAYYNPIKSEYYCRNIGVIKREYFDGTIWELTNYHHNK